MTGSGEPISVVELLERRKSSGDLERFQTLCEPLLPVLHGWLAIRIRPGLRGRIEPEDLVQETWLRGLRAFERFDPAQASFQAWIFGVVKNVLREALRELQAEPHATAGSSSRGSMLQSVPDDVTSVTRRIARDDALRRFLERVEDLGDDGREIVLLCALEGLTHREAALRLGLSEEALRKRWQRLRAELVQSGVASRLLGRDAD